MWNIEQLSLLHSCSVDGTRTPQRQATNNLPCEKSTMKKFAMLIFQVPCCVRFLKLIHLAYWISMARPRNKTCFTCVIWFSVCTSIFLFYALTRFIGCFFLKLWDISYHWNCIFTIIMLQWILSSVCFFVIHLSKGKQKEFTFRIGHLVNDVECVSQISTPEHNFFKLKLR